MKNTLKLNHAKREIVMDRTFAKFAENTMSAEYAHLQQVRKDYPTYAVIQRQIKKNNNKESYPVIKAWFLEMYPEVKNFGMKAEAVAEEQEETESQDNVVEIPNQEQEENIPA